jgi:integrase
MPSKKAPSAKGFPLFLHPSGQWAKMVRNPSTGKRKCFYFGTDRNDAIKRWNAERDALFAGVTPKGRASDKPSLAELANVYLAAKREENRVSGKPGLRAIDLSEYTLKHLARLIGKEAIIEDLSPTDFARIKLQLFSPIKRDKPTRGKVWGRQVEKRSAETVAGDVRRIRTFLNWCYQAEHIPAPRYGAMFPIDTEMAHTKESVKKVRKDFSADDLRRIIEAAKPSFQPLILLGINSGLGNRDIATMTLDDIAGIEAATPFIDLPRLKNGGDRRFLLWPETVSSIKTYLANRPAPKKGYENVLFLTMHGHPWMRGEGHMDLVDSIGSGFTKLRKECGIARGSFYDLRRTFATVACECMDLDAVRCCMGHKPSKQNVLGRVYNQHIGDDRIAKVSHHVREWLFGKTSQKTSRKPRCG